MVQYPCGFPRSVSHILHFINYDPCDTSRLAIFHHVPQFSTASAHGSVDGSTAVHRISVFLAIFLQPIELCRHRPRFASGSVIVEVGFYFLMGKVTHKLSRGLTMQFLDLCSSLIFSVIISFISLDSAFVGA